MNTDLHGFLSEEQKARYRRQLIMPEIGVKGQARLSKGKVLIVGLGGLGSISSSYLAAAGVGWIRIVDHDVVALDNLNRQLLHSTPDMGRLKTDSAAEKLRRLNPECRIEPVHALLEEENGRSLAEGCDLIVDATDNVSSRIALNRASLALGIPLLYGGIHGWDGTAAAFVPGKTCCFECLFHSRDIEKPKGPFPAFGPAAGVIGSIQATEAVRILLGMAPALSSRLLKFQGNGLRFRVVHVEKDPACARCGAQDGV